MSESLLEKYPHLKLLTKLKKPPVLPLPDNIAATDQNENIPSTESIQAAPAGRISLLGPGVGSRTPLVPLYPPPLNEHIPRTKVFAEDLFAASVAADDDQWLQFQVEDNVPAKQQLDELKMWLMANSPSIVSRSSGVGWIAVKFKDKGKKVLEAKAAWDSFEGEKSMEVVNNLAEEFRVKGGKWLCHLPTGLIDQVWSKLATTLMCGGLGPSVYMVKVSPRQDIHPEQSRGEHVICVYNTDYKDTEQVMRVENLMRSAGVTTILTYKPDIFSALGIYRNNKWGFRPTIYSSRVLVMEGKSRVETVGTNNWYYNSSKGLQYPVERKDVSSRDEDMRNMVVGGGKENEGKETSLKENSEVSKTDKSINKSIKEKVDKFLMERIEDLKSVKVVKEKKVTNLLPSKAELPFQSVDEMKNLVPAGLDDHRVEQRVETLPLDMVDMEAMKMPTKHDRVDQNIEQSPDPKSAVKKQLKYKKNKFDDGTLKLGVEDLQVVAAVGSYTESKSFDRVKLTTQGVIDTKEEKSQDENKEKKQESNTSNKKQKPAWLFKLEQLQ